MPTACDTWGPLSGDKQTECGEQLVQDGNCRRCCCRGDRIDLEPLVRAFNTISRILPAIRPVRSMLIRFQSASWYSQCCSCNLGGASTCDAHTAQDSSSFSKASIPGQNTRDQAMPLIYTIPG